MAENITSSDQEKINLIRGMAHHLGMTLSDVRSILSVYSEDEPKVYTITDAAEYLGIAVPTVKYHIYQSKGLVPDINTGAQILFYEKTLEEFKAKPRRPGPKPKR